VTGAVAIHHGDNLAVARRLPDAAFTLVYLDPPFNTGRSRTRVAAVDAPTPDVHRGFRDREYTRLRGDLGVYADEFQDYWAFLEPRLLGRGGCSRTTARCTCTSTTARSITRRCCSTRSSGASDS
jgi:site-specific DNA-methyltransferase (adenine-specific)